MGGAAGAAGAGDGAGMSYRGRVSRYSRISASVMRVPPSAAKHSLSPVMISGVVGFAKLRVGVEVLLDIRSQAVARML